MSAHLQSESTRGSGLTPAQLKKLRTRLLEVRKETLARLHDEETTARFSDSLPEAMDAAELAREQGDAAEQSERFRTRLREIDDALARIDAGSYGISERSGQPIGFDRLAAVPWARYGADEER
jgi:DnaK suppressor protein